MLVYGSRSSHTSTRLLQSSLVRLKKVLIEVFDNVLGRYKFLFWFEIDWFDVL